MNYDKKELMNEGWESMSKMLDQEMPVEKKDRTFLWMFLFVLLAFGSGVGVGQFILAQKISKAKKVAALPTLDLPLNQAVSAVNQADLSNLSTLNISAHNVVAHNYSAFANTAPESINNSFQNNSTHHNSLAHNSVQKPVNFAALNAATLMGYAAVATSFSTPKNSEQKTALVLSQQRDKHNELFAINLFTANELNSKPLPVYYLPDSNDKVKKLSKWEIALALGAGINWRSESKVASLKTEWLYKLGKDNAIGFEFVLAAEDEIDFFRNEPILVQPTDSRFAPDVLAVADGKEPTKSYSRVTNPRQLRYAGGAVISQDIGYRFYTNVAAGIDVLQNTFSAVSQPDQVKYHLGGYSSISAGYHLTKIIDFEVSGTKSWSLQNTEGFTAGNINHLVAGIKLSF